MSNSKPKITAGGPRPQRKDYETDADFSEAIEEWTKLNTPTPSITPLPGIVPIENVESDVTQNTGKVRTDWNIFTDGSLNIQEGNAEVGQTPFVTARLEEFGEEKPTPVVILPSSDGKGFTLVAREVLLQQVIGNIQRSPNNASYWKTQLQNYYRSKNAFETSLRGGPVTDKDTEFVYALRRALGEISTDNFSAGVENVKAGRLNSSGFYDLNSWITSRTPIPGSQSESISTRNFTKKSDAIADFMREVQLQVGDPGLVDNIDSLAEAYWDKVHSEELKRMGQSTSTYDPITGVRISKSTGFAMPSEQLLKEWRIGFITKGAVEKGKVISLGIRNVSVEDLQDAGGILGDNYTKLKGFSFQYGVKITDEELKAKAAEVSRRGGSIEEQARTLMMASKLRYPALAQYIEGGLSVSDIANPYINKKLSTLELPAGSIDIFDSDIQAALTSEKLLGDIAFEGLLRSNPAYRFTKQANEFAAGFLDQFLKLVGKVG